MKAKYLWVAILALTFFGCDDNTGTLGLDMFPDSDKNVNANSQTFQVITNSFLSGPVYAKTNIAYLGKYTDPAFGFFESDFMAQLHCTEGITFPEKGYDPETNTGDLVGDSILTTRLFLSYSKSGGYFGDSLNACRLSVYELDQRLDTNYMTNVDPTKFYNENDPKSLLGRKAYTAVDLSVSEEVRNGSNYAPSVAITLPKEIGERFLRKFRENKGYFDSSESFIDNVFKGIYVKSDYGDGTVLYIENIQLLVYYNLIQRDKDGKVLKSKLEGHTTEDSIKTMARIFATTEEVLQINQFKNSDKLEAKVAEKEHTYLKSPAGIFTEGTLPLDSIAMELSNDTINAVSLTFTNYNQPSKGTYSMSAPSNVLLVRKQDRDTFFEENKLPDQSTSYTTSHRSTNQYVFPNITRLITTCLDEKAQAKKEAGANWDEKQWMTDHPDWNKFVLIPVLISYDNSQNKNIISVQHDLKPGYVKLKGGDPKSGGEALKLQVIYTNFDGKK